MHLPELETAEAIGYKSAEPNLVLSPWTASRAKRIFDIIAVLMFAPIVTPLLLVIGMMVLAICGRPILFRQVRIGHSGRPFSILKFRTMCMLPVDVQSAIAALSAERITPLGRILRRLKLDELPQVLNVLAGDMSLVGPRPKVLEQQIGTLACRPGITGSATLIFAREEALLRRIGIDAVPEYYRTAILPAKTKLDAEYMARATFLSDLRILLNTVLGKW